MHHNFDLLNLKIGFIITNATVCFFDLDLPFLVSSFVVRSNDDMYLICTQSIPFKKFMFITESEEKSE